MKTSKKILGLILGMILFYVVFTILSDAEKVLENFTKMDLKIIPLILLSSFFVLLAKGFRQYYLLKRLGLDIDFKTNYIIFFSGLTMLITPGGMGEVIKSYYLKKSHGEGMSKTFPFVLMERAHDLLAVISIVSILLFFSDVEEVKILIIGLWIIFIIIYSMVKQKSTFMKLINYFKKIKKTEKYLSQLSQSYESLHNLSNSKFVFKMWIISIISWVFTAISYYLCFVALNIQIDPIKSTIFTFISVAFGALSLLPGGVGITEISLTGFLVNDGIELAVASSVVLLIRLTGTWFATGLGFVATRSVLKQIK